MLLLLVSTAFAVGPLQNGGFETGDFTSWNSWGTGTVIADEGFEGSHAAQMSLDPTIDGFQESGMYQDVTGAVVGEHLRLSMMARALPSDPMTGTGVLFLDWEVYGPNDFSDFGVVEVALASDGSWSERTIDFVFPEGATHVRYVVLLDGETLGTSGTVQVDDLRLTAIVEDDTDAADTDPADDTDPAGDTDTTADTGCGCANAPGAPFAAWIAVILAFSGAARRSGCSRA